MASSSTARNEGDRHKERVALSSVAAAVFLTLLKLIVGLWTGSLGILAEVAHSALDLVAALMTWFAVRVSGRPADSRHTYGHGKVENLSALFETLLLLGTCIWIIYEAVRRLLLDTVEITATRWGIAVMLVAIVVDVSRSRALSRAAKRYDSQALEADALHFATDVWSSAVVIVGLLFVEVADWIGRPWLRKADAVAAMGVAAIVTYVSLQLGRRTVAALIDEAPPGLRRAIEKAARVPGTVAVDRVRVRRSGPDAFVDVTLKVDREMGLQEAHAVADAAEQAVQSLLPGADVVVHVEPEQLAGDDPLHLVRSLAVRHGLGVHGIRVYDLGSQRAVEMHVEVPESMQLNDAHHAVTQLEQDLRRTLPGDWEVLTHIEPAGESRSPDAVTDADHQQIGRAMEEIAELAGERARLHHLRLSRDVDGLNISFHCALDGTVGIAEAHALAEELEQALRDRVPGLGRVTIHVEPHEEA